MGNQWVRLFSSVATVLFYEHNAEAMAMDTQFRKGFQIHHSSANMENKLFFSYFFYFNSNRSQNQWNLPFSTHFQAPGTRKWSCELWFYKSIITGYYRVRGVVPGVLICIGDTVLAPKTVRPWKCLLCGRTRFRIPDADNTTTFTVSILVPTKNY